MKKILFTANVGCPSENTGGSNKIIFELLKKLDHNYYVLSYISYDYNKNYMQESKDNFQMVRNYRKRIGNNLYAQNKIYRRITSTKWYLNLYNVRKERYLHKKAYEYKDYNIIHSHDSLILSYFSKVPKPKKILSLHSKGAILSEILEGKQNAISEKEIQNISFKEREALNSADIITFPSHAARRLFESDYDTHIFNNKDVRIVYNGVDIEKIENVSYDKGYFYKYINADKNQLKILNVGQHVPPKNLKLIIETVKILKYKYQVVVSFINVGFGLQTEELIDLAKSYNLSDNVKFIGQVNNTDVIKLMKDCDIFLMPSNRVVFDMVILEALASNACVIASAEGGNLEIIRDGHNGYLLEHLDPEYIALKIINVNLDKVRKNGQISIKKFSNIEMRNNYEKIYGELISE